MIESHSENSGASSAIEDVARFLEFAGHSLRHKRKTLRNNLRPFYAKLVDVWPEARLLAVQIPLGRPDRKAISATNTHEFTLMRRPLSDSCSFVSIRGQSVFAVFP